MTEDIFYCGKFDDPSDPRQLEELWAWMQRVQGRINQFDPNAFALAWLEGYAAGAVIASKGVASAPEWETEPLLTGLTLSGLTASQMVVTDASKKLTSSSKQGVTNGDTHDHAGGDGAQIDHGGLAGLADDDHSQYHNDTRGDARYVQLPGSPGAYTESNVTTDRTFDANATTLEELADIVGTLIADLRTAGLVD